jgi:hypothetical protein
MIVRFCCTPADVHQVSPKSLSTLAVQRNGEGFVKRTIAQSTFGTSTSSRSSGRKRSLTEGDDSEDDADDNGSQSIPSVTTESFNIADVKALKDFWHKRFKCLTLKPTRKVVTAWVEYRWPDRRAYPYDRKDCPAVRGPVPGWPDGVEYREPSHLKGNGEPGLENSACQC